MTEANLKNRKQQSRKKKNGVYDDGNAAPYEVERKTCW